METLPEYELPIGGKITIEIERGESGAYFVTSPDDKGMLVAKHSMGDAFSSITRCLSLLKYARETYGGDFPGIATQNMR